jgi:hypothetical protein
VGVYVDKLYAHMSKKYTDRGKTPPPTLYASCEKFASERQAWVEEIEARWAAESDENPFSRPSSNTP